MHVDEVMDEVKKDILYYDESDGGVTFSGGEPLVQRDFLRALLMACKKEEIHTTVDTCGYVKREDFEAINTWTDLYYFDLKLLDDELHQKYTGVSNKRILANLDYLITGRKKVELRIPLIPGITDTNDNIEQTINFIKALPAALPVHLLPYNQIGEGKFERFNVERKLGKLKMQSEKQIQEIQEQFVNAGILVV